MPDYKALYFKLFAAMADAVELLEEQDYGSARRLLIAAQQEAEENCISEA